MPIYLASWNTMLYYLPPQILPVCYSKLAVITTIMLCTSNYKVLPYGFCCSVILLPLLLPVSWHHLLSALTNRRQTTKFLNDTGTLASAFLISFTNEMSSQGTQSTDIHIGDLIQHVCLSESFDPFLQGQPWSSAIFTSFYVGQYFFQLSKLSKQCIKPASWDPCWEAKSWVVAKCPLTDKLFLMQFHIPTLWSSTS